MADITIAEYRRLVERQCLTLAEIVRSVAQGDPGVEFDMPEGVDVLADLVSSTEVMVRKMRESMAEHERTRADLEESRRQLELVLRDREVAQQRYQRSARRERGEQPAQGYAITENGPVPAASVWLSPMTQSVRQRTTVAEVQEQRATLALPILAGNRVIGALGFERPSDEEWTKDEIANAEAIVAQLAQALENQRLLDEELQARIALNRQVKALDCLNDIGRRTEDSPEIPGFLQWVAERIPVAMRYSDVCLVAIEFDRRIYGRVDALQMPRQMVQELRVRGELAGEISVGYETDREFLDEESILLTDIARRVSGYIESRSLLDETQANAEEFAVLYELGRGLSARLDMEEVLDQVRQVVSRLMGATHFRIGLYDRARSQVTFPLSVSESVVDRHATAVSSDEGLTGYVIHTRESLLIENDAGEWMRAKGMSIEGESAQCWLGVPLMISGEVYGLIIVEDHTTPYVFTAIDRDRLTAIANQAAIAIQNALLFEEIQARARSEQTLREITARVRASVDPDVIVRTAVRELGVALGRRSFVHLVGGEPSARSEGGE